MTYPLLSLAFVALSAVPAVVLRLRRPGRRRWPALALTLAILLVLTAVFDTIMIGVGLVWYDESAMTGLRIGLAPIEDFAWPVATVLALPALWELLGPGAGTRRGRVSAPGREEDA